MLLAERQLSKDGGDVDAGLHAGFRGRVWKSRGLRVMMVVIMRQPIPINTILLPLQLLNHPLIRTQQLLHLFNIPLFSLHLQLILPHQGGQLTYRLIILQLPLDILYLLYYYPRGVLLNTVLQLSL